MVWGAVTNINPHRIYFHGRYYGGTALSNATLQNYLNAGNKLILAQVNGGAHWVALSTHNTVDKYIVSHPGSFTGYGVYTITP